MPGVMPSYHRCFTSYNGTKARLLFVSPVGVLRGSFSCGQLIVNFCVSSKRNSNYFKNYYLRHVI